MMNQQQIKAFKYIYSVADGYRRVLPLYPNSISTLPIFTDYNRFYKDIRENTSGDWEGWKKIADLVALSPSEVSAFGKTWDFRDIKNLVFAEYKKIWEEKNIQFYPSEYNVDIQMFNAYLLSPNCFETVRLVITGESLSDLQRYNNLVKSSIIAYIRKITLLEWNTRDVNSKTTLKDRWYDRINVIEQL